MCYQRQFLDSRLCCDNNNDTMLKIKLKITCCCFCIMWRIALVGRSHYIWLLLTTRKHLVLLTGSKFFKRLLSHWRTAAAELHWPADRVVQQVGIWCNPTQVPWHHSRCQNYVCSSHIKHCEQDQLCTWTPHMLLPRWYWHAEISQHDFSCVLQNLLT